MIYGFTENAPRPPGEGSGDTARAASNRCPARWGIWTAYAACVLALLHAGVSFYWAVGAAAGLSTVGGELEELVRTRDPGFIALVWATGLMKAACGLLALALVRFWGSVFPR